MTWTSSFTYFFFTDDSILFVEANLKQVEVVKGVWRIFLNALARSLIAPSSKFSIQKVMSLHMHRHLANAIGFTEMKDLCRYLGILLLHSRVTKKTY